MPSMKVVKILSRNKHKSSYAQATLHAIVMLFCVILLLGAIYTQMQPYKFTSSNMAFRHALKMDDAAEIRDFDEIWDWIDSIAEDVSGRTLSHVTSNCAYNEPNTQFIKVDNVTYEIHNPATQYGACQGLEYIDAAKDAVFLTGDNEILLFGLFSKRSVDHLSAKRSVNHLRTHRVREKNWKPLDPSGDPKIIEVCEAPWNSSNLCVKEDGFFRPGYYDNSPGSALHWKGEKRGGKYAFNSSSKGILHRAGQPFKELLPCYAYSSEEDIHWGSPDYSGEDIMDTELSQCEDIWVTSGFDLRTLCLDTLNDQPSPQDAYIAAINNFSSIIEMLDFFNGCNYVLNSSPQELEYLFSEADSVFRSHLSFDDTYGTFFNTTNQGSWLQDHTFVQNSLEFHRVLDQNTREFTVYITTRNLGDSALFYTLLRVKYTHKTDGSLRVGLKPSYIPIIQVEIVWTILCI